MTETTETPPAVKTDWLSILQLTGSLLGLLLVVLIAAGFTFLLFLLDLSHNPSADSAVVFSIQLAGALLAGLIMLSSAVLALLKITQIPVQIPPIWPPVRKLLHPKYWMASIPLWLLAGHFSIQSDFLPWLVAPAAHVMIAAIPCLWLIWAATRGLEKGSLQRTSGLSASGIMLSTGIAFFLEILVAVLILFVVLRDLDNRMWMQELSWQIDNLSPDELFPAMYEKLNKPGILFGFLAYIAVLVPVIEELIKPIGVWLLAGRKLTPAEGFTAGVISGAAFGLFENLVNAGEGASWAGLAAMRIGTTAVHVLTTGLMGWAWVNFWQNKKFLRLLLTYTTAVLIHGLWNSMPVVTSFADFQVQSPVVPASFAVTGPIVLLLLAGGCLALLFYFNRKLKTAAGEPQDKLVDQIEIV